MRWLLLSTAMLVAMLGCRNNAQLDAHLELMNAERRALEDELYALEYDYEATAQKLEESRRENERLRGELNGSSGDFQDLSPGDADPGGDLPEFDLGPPTVEPGVPSTPPNVLEGPPNVLEDPQGNGQREEPMRQSVSLRQRFSSTNSSGPPITHIFIDPALTEGSDFDRRPGDDGITVVIEPRDDSANFVPQAGAVSVVLLDYANRGEGDAARVARWDLDAGQTKQRLYDADHRRGIHLELPWPGQPPKHSRLRLDVRFTTQDGRQLETRQDIRVSTGADSRDTTDAADGSYSTANSGGWTPRSVNRVQGDVNVARQPSQDHKAGPVPGAPWSLEQAAGDAIRREPITGSGEDPPEQSAQRPEWRPYR